MSKVPLKQLSVNTFESQRVVTPVKKPSVIIKKKPKPIEEKSLDIPTILQQSSRMTTNEFETFVQTTAPDGYWHIMAEFYRNKLEDVTRENQQLHDIVDQLNTDNSNLRAVADHCEYLADLVEKLTSDDKTEPDKKSSVCVRLF